MRASNITLSPAIVIHRAPPRHPLSRLRSLLRRLMRMAGLRTALRLAPRSHLLRPSPTASRTAPLLQRSYAAPVRRPADDQKPIEEVELAQEDLNDENDPGMNGGYPDPSLNSALPVKRSLRDPYGGWWDPIERRNYGEPVHEDNDILGVFSTEEYRHFSPARGAILLGCFIASIGLLAAIVGRTYPDLPAAPRTFPGGLEKELGGPNAIRARETDDEEIDF